MLSCGEAKAAAMWYTASTALHRPLHGGVVAQVALHQLDVGDAVQLVRPAGVAGKHEAADLVALPQQPAHQVGADASVGTGDQNLHCQTSTR